MRIAFRAAFLAVLVTLPAAVLGQAAYDIPNAAEARQGQTSKFKYILDGKVSVMAAGQKMPASLSAVATVTHKYGYLKEGLYPVTINAQLTSLKGNFAGQSIPKDAIKEMAPPVTTLFYDQDGLVRKARTAMSVKGKQQTQVWMPSADELAKMSQQAFIPQTKNLVIGQTFVQNFNYPEKDPMFPLVVTFVPVEVVQIQGEQAIRLQVQANTLADLGDLYKEASRQMQIASADAGLQGLLGPEQLNIQMGGKMYLNIDGNVYMGLNSGEMLKHDLKPYFLMQMDMMGQMMDVELDMTLNGYRIP